METAWRRASAMSSDSRSGRSSVVRRHAWRRRAAHWAMIRDAEVSPAAAQDLVLARTSSSMSTASAGVASLSAGREGKYARRGISS